MLKYRDIGIRDVLEQAIRVCEGEIVQSLGEIHEENKGKRKI